MTNTVKTRYSTRPRQLGPLMKCSAGVVCLILVAVLAAPSNASVIATEFFNGYGTSEIIIGGGPDLNGGTGWNGAWLIGDHKYVPGANLSYNATGYNNAANVGGHGDGAMAYAGNLPNPSSSWVVREFASAPAGTAWISALISIDETWDRATLWIDSTAASGNSGDFVGVLDNNIQMRYNGDDFTTAGTPTIGTHLLLAKVELNISGGNDRLSFWFDPDLSGGEAGLGSPTYSAEGADTFGDSLDGIGVLLINRDEDGLGGYVTDSDTEVEGGELIDAIFVGTTFDAVTRLHPDIIAEEYFNDYGTTDLTMEAIPDGGGEGWTSEWGDQGAGTDDNGYRAGASLSVSKAGYDNSANLGGPSHGAAGYGAANPGPSITPRLFNTTATTVWFSALVNRGNDTSHALLWIDSTSDSGGNSQDFIGLLNGTLAIRYNNVTSSGALVEVGTTYLVLGKAEIDISGSNDRLSFWFDPDLTGGETGLGSPTFTDDTADTFGALIDGVGVMTTKEGLIDAIRVGRTLESVSAFYSPIMGTLIFVK